MVGDPPPGFGQGPAQPPVGNWPPRPLGQPATRSRPWLAIAVAVTAGLAVAALAVALTRPTSSHSSITTTTAPSYTPAQTAAAQQRLCDTYKLVARAVEVDTSGNDRALARIADTNGAVLLNMAADDPALDAYHRDTGRALATAYGTVTAKGNNVVASDADYQAALDDVIAKDAAMKKVCGGG
ncbi:hypothetical protein [Mycobacterium sp. 852002-10029_SCH5224772]|uniref:hypothetical protein n=1 Tax=Mycobacterium sp. 852002-10029_SCH5224772 TaxID=1834083 RepID=UPI0007FCBFD9|nr:hypothetical protein [Mycobacterium sp. 852002-10029_SCH5224772]OBF04352.1 hypothetical protein A5775_01845 [Mycobacterium sp. 852002-10029_SCH5224772]